ncbi:MAG: universal stress protein [Chloroflexota bacterium]
MTPGGRDAVPAATPGRGRLRVYLGMAPGVGKTWEMLQEAHRRRDRGTDVVVGIVETHGRPQTAALLDGLEVVPRRRIEHRGVVIEEMDTAAILARRPAVVLVDELAHTNAPGSPREKRWQDVEALRDAGIDVISTCNVQHLASQADAVATITGAPVHERLPDAVLATADELELIDMSPHALRQRMRHGNVYPPERAQLALDRFFTEANLTALRELSLRFTAGRVEAQLEAMDAPAAPEVAGTGRVLVLVDERPASRRALRRGAAMAADLHARFTALTVATPDAGGPGQDRERDLRENVAYARDLGADVARVEADDLVEGILLGARSRNATVLVLAYRPPTRLERLRGRLPLERILAAEPDLEVHVVGAGPDRPDPYQAGAGRM